MNKIITNNQLDQKIQELDINFEKSIKFIFDVFNNKAIKKILFVHPHDVGSKTFNFDVAKRGGYYNFPPYGLGVLAKKVSDIGIETQISGLQNHILKQCQKTIDKKSFNFDKVWQSKLSNDIKVFQPDMIAVTCLFTMTYEPFKEVCKRVSAIKPTWLENRSSIPLAVGGVHVSQYTEAVLEDLPMVEFIFLNEADTALCNFIKTVNRIPSGDLAQVIINTPSEKIFFRNLAKPSEADINTIPDFDKMKVEEYTSNGRVGAFTWTRKNGTRFASVLSNRGCRASCTFCNVRNFNGVGVRQRSIGSVLEEIKILNQKFGVEHITWLDDDLLFNERRAIQLFNEIVKQNIKITWDAMNGVIAASCKDEVISAAAESGCVAVNIGIESGNAKIQQQIRKPGNSRKFLQAAEIFKKYEKINARLFLMLGFPGETYRMIADTILLSLEMDLDWNSITILQPWKTTPIYEAMIEQGQIEKRQGSLEGKYSSGPFGKQRSVEIDYSVNLHDFKKFFAEEKIDQIPTKSDLLDIWFFSNYYLNFNRLFKEKRHSKISQQYKNLDNICNVVAPGNGFALYFKALMESKNYNSVETQTINDLEKVLENSVFWTDTFSNLGLSIEHLQQNSFPNNSDSKTDLGFNALTPGWFK